MKKISKIVLHVGPYKTGSTSIQSFSHRHRDAIRDEHSILYPSFHYDHGPLLRSAFSQEPEKLHDNVVRSLDKEQILAEVNHCLSFLEKEVSSHQVETLFLSGEHISDLNKIELDKLREYLSKFCDNISVVYFVRNPSSLIISDLQESVKTGRATFNDWKFDYLLPRYFEKIDHLEKVFGANNVAVLEFERLVKSPKGLVGAFFEEVLNVTVDVDREERSNDSVSDFAFRMLEKLNISSPSVVNGSFNHQRSKKLVSLLKSHKGSKIKFPCDLTTKFCEQINDRLKRIKKKFAISYGSFPAFPSGVSSSEDMVKVDANDLQTFVDLLNSTFNSEKEHANKLAHSIRDIALDLEEKDPTVALELMKVAGELKPDGPYIKRKIAELSKGA